MIVLETACDDASCFRYVYGKGMDIANFIYMVMRNGNFNLCCLVMFMFAFSACQEDEVLLRQKEITYIFWGTLGSSTIERARIEGEILIEQAILYDADDGVEAPTSVAVDTENRMIYWVDFDARKIVRGSWDGQQVPEVLYTISQLDIGPVELTLDSDGGYIYWTQPFDDLILRASATGNGGVDTLFSSKDGVKGAWGINVEVTNGYLYWVEYQDVELYRARLDGWSPELLYAGGSGFIKPYGLSVDIKNQILLVADNPPPGGGLTDRIMRGSLDGTDPLVTLYDQDDGVNNVYHLFVEPTSGKIYWHNKLSDGAIWQGSIGDVSKPKKLIEHIDIGQGLAVALINE